MTCILYAIPQGWLTLWKIPVVVATLHVFLVDLYNNGWTFPYYTVKSCINMVDNCFQYTIDTGLDEVWQNYLADILSEPRLPTNPHAQLVTTFRHAAMM